MMKCEECGTRVENAHGSRRFCDPCGVKRHRKVARGWWQDQNQGSYRVGSEMPCKRCGCMLIKRSGAHKFCGDCAEVRGKENREAWLVKQGKVLRRRDVYDNPLEVHIGVNLPRGLGNDFKSRCKEDGVSISSCLRSLVKEHLCES